MEKSMMILGAGPLQVPAIKKAKEMGYKLILVDYDENAVGFEYADVRLIVSTQDMEEVYRQALIYEPDVVITSTSDAPVRTAAYVNEKLGKRPDLSYEDSVCATVKNYMRDRFRENNVPIPDYCAVSDYESFKKAVSEFGGYCIVKPADNAGSRGVRLLDVRENFNWQRAESAACIGQDDRVCDTDGVDLDERLKEIYYYSMENSRGKTLMVEEFMDGAEVSVEAMTIDGETQVLAITDKYITPPPYFVELAHCEPSMLDDELKERIKQAAVAAVSALKLKNGPSHTEIKVTKDGPKVVESAARLGGDFITSRLVPLSTGIDMVGASVELAVGKKVDLSPKWSRGAAVFFIQAGEGIIKRISVPDEVYNLKGVEEVSIYKKAGERTSGTKSSNDRLGHIIVSADTAAGAMEAGRKALGMIEVEEA